MRCESKFEDVIYSSELFCKSCGMDIGLNPVFKRKRSKIMPYCCEECAESG